MKMYWIVALAALVLVGLWQPWNKSVPVDAARVVDGPIREFVDEQGQTRIPQTHLVTMPFTGRIEPIELVEGTLVKKDQAVARVVPRDLELAVADAQAAVDRAAASIAENADNSVELTSLEQSLKFVESMNSTVQAAENRVRSGEAKLDFATKHLRRIQTQHQSKAASDEQLNSAELAHVEAEVDYRQDVLILKSLQAMQAATALGPTMVRQYIGRKGLTGNVRTEERTQAEARLQQQLRDQQRGEMRSPIDGVVLERHESNERLVSAGTVLLAIGDPNRIEVEADILSQDVVQVKVGNPVEVYGPAIGAKPAAGTVQRIYPAGFTKVSSLGVEQQRVRVVVGFTPGELQRLRGERDLGIGYRVRVRIVTAEKASARLVPRAALFRGPAGDWQLFAIVDGVARLRSVQVGLLNDDRAEILAGLDDAEQVVLSPESALVDGTSVRPILSQATP